MADIEKLAADARRILEDGRSNYLPDAVTKALQNERITDAVEVAQLKPQIIAKMHEPKSESEKPFWKNALNRKSGTTKQKLTPWERAKADFRYLHISQLDGGECRVFFAGFEISVRLQEGEAYCTDNVDPDERYLTAEDYAFFCWLGERLRPGVIAAYASNNPEELSLPGTDDWHMQRKPAFGGQTTRYRQPSAAPKRPNAAHCVRARETFLYRMFRSNPDDLECTWISEDILAFRVYGYRAYKVPMEFNWIPDENHFEYRIHRDNIPAWVPYAVQSEKKYFLLIFSKNVRHAIEDAHRHRWDTELTPLERPESKPQGHQQLTLPQIH